jgi:hypothetical protein
MLQKDSSKSEFVWLILLIGALLTVPLSFIAGIYSMKRNQEAQLEDFRDRSAPLRFLFIPSREDKPTSKKYFLFDKKKDNCCPVHQTN